MRKLAKKLLIVLLVFTLATKPISTLYSIPTMIVTEAHSGRTDSNGGHKDNKNKSGLGSYHYHCGGNPAHLHKDGKCPYKTSSSSKSKTTKSSSKTTGSKKATSSKEIKKVQSKLNELGYDCGKPDGIMGKNTKAALKKYQKDNGLTVDGVIGKEVKKALGIS